MPTLRSRPQRRRDTEHRLTHDKDVLGASASADGAPYLVPLSLAWDGEALQQRGDRFAARTGFDPRALPRRTAGSVSPRVASRLGAR